MNRFVLALLATLPFGGGAVAADPHEKPNLVTILAAPDAQTQLMAMTLTHQSMKQGAKVRVLLCGPAGDIALKSPPAAATAPQKPAGTTPQGVLIAMLEAGAPVEVCATYLPNRAIDADALIAGVGQARPDAVAGHLLGPNTRILSF